MEGYFSKKKRGGQINSRISNQDSLAAVYAVEQLSTIDIFNFGIEIKEFSIQCEGDDDISITNIDNKIFIQVKSSVIGNKEFYKVMDDFLENNSDERECFFILAIFENIKVNNKNIVERLKAYRNVYMDKNETKEKKARVKVEFIKDFKLEKYIEIIDNFVIDSRPLFRENRDTAAIFSRDLRLAYDFKSQKEYYIDRAYKQLVYKMGELRLSRGTIDREEIEEIIGNELIKDSLFDQFYRSCGYKKIENGYIPNNENREKLIRIEKGRRKAHKNIMKEWRKGYFKEFIKSLYRGGYRCPKCNHPMIANLNGMRGIACPDCGYSPYATIFLFCECGEFNVVKTQPELEDLKILHYINNYHKNEKKICKKCGGVLFDEYLEWRIILLPIPYPVDRYKEIEEIYK